MKKRVCIREAGSFVAGLLIGLSIVLYGLRDDGLGFRSLASGVAFAAAGCVSIRTRGSVCRCC